MPDSRDREAAGHTSQTLVGGAPVSIQTLEEALIHGPRLIAADGGADRLLSLGLVPDLVVGDMDSISAAARDAFADRLRPIAEQESTDFAKALRTCPAGLTIAIGFIGARVDHFLACLTELARSGARCVLLGEEDCVCIAPAVCDLDLVPGTRLSLWPLSEVSGTSRGLRWPIDGLRLDPTRRTGTSNEATGPVHLELAGTAALLMPPAALPALLAALPSDPRTATPGAI